MNQPFKFPSLKTIAPDSAHRFSKKIKFALRKQLCKKQIQELENYANHNEFARNLLSQYHGAPYSLIHLYVNRKFNKDQRLQAILHDLKTSEKLLKLAFEKTNSIEIMQINEALHLVLEINPVEIGEGFWSFTLYNDKHEILYNFTFAFLPTNSLVITSTQGPNLEGSKEIMRNLTKQMHGLRPQQFVIWMMQTLVEQLKVNSLLGIAQEQHMKARGALKKRLHINYDEIWKEYGGVPNKEGYWDLPLVREQKKIEDVASKKRAMYRRRYAMQEQIAQNLQEALKLDNK